MKNRILAKMNLFIISLILLCITAIAPVYANENSSIVQIPVQQIFDTKYADVDNQFTYVLEPEHDTDPMPVKSQNHRFIWTMGEKTDTVLFKNKYTPNKGSLDRARDFVNTSIYNAKFSYLALAIVSLLTLLMLLMLLIKKEGVHNEK